MVVWGHWHTELFVSVSLPTQLAPGNLPALASTGRLRYRIYASADAAREIRNSAAFSRLEAVLDPEFVEIEVPEVTDKYDLMTRCHRDAITVAASADAALIFLAPDLIMCADALSVAHDAALNGKRAVLTINPPVTEEAVSGLRHAQQGADYSLTVSNRDVVRMIVDYLHPEMRRRAWTSREFTRWPATVLWEVPGEGMIAHSFHYHPFLLWPADFTALPNETVDGSYVVAAVPNADDIHVVRESAELVMCSVEPHHKSPLPPRRSSAMRVAAWAVGRVKPHHRYFAREPVAFRLDTPSAGWLETEMAAGAAMRRIERLLRLRALGARYWHEDRSRIRARLAAMRARR